MTNKEVQSAIDEARTSIVAQWKKCKNTKILQDELQVAVMSSIMWSKMNKKQRAMARAFLREMQNMFKAEDYDRYGNIHGSENI
jgi:transcriptional regulator of acetoin/glycerol metabolism